MSTRRKIRTPKPLKESTILSRVKSFIENNKFLSNPKYFKNNFWSWAHFSSWVAEGKCGMCLICRDYPIASLCNTRHTTKFCKKTHDGYICYTCVKKVEEEINCEFKRR